MVESGCPGREVVIEAAPRAYTNDVVVETRLAKRERDPSVLTDCIYGQGRGKLQVLHPKNVKQ